MKGRTQPIILLMVMSLVVVPWLSLASSAPLLSVVDANAAALKLKAEYMYMQVNFSTASATPDTYKSFIASVCAGLVNTTRTAAAGGNSSSSGTIPIPVLVTEEDRVALQASLNVNLADKAGRSVSLKMNVSGASFSGYEAGNYSCLLTRAAGGALSTQTTNVSCYHNWYPWEGRPSVNVEVPAVAAWRVEDLDEAISSLFLFPNGNATTEDLGRGLLACDVMIAAAATFPDVERRLSAGMWAGSGVPNDGIALLRWSWRFLSAAVQGSYQGAFAAAVHVQRSDGEWMTVDTVRRAVTLVSFLENAGCKNKTQATAACGEAEPTVRLVGLEGRCVDVPYGVYYRGNQVQLWTCNSNAAAAGNNQLWTLKRDGTIRCDGMRMCLAASGGGKAGDRVVIDECPPRGVPAARAVWEVRADGTVALKGSRLVLAVNSSANGARLTVGREDRGTGQSWTPTNDTAPLNATIAGFRDLCLKVDCDRAVSVGACGGNNGVGVGVQWSVYPDGSIRPPPWLQCQCQCLAADASGRVWVKRCDWAGSSGDRWVFRSDGTIFNTGTGMVLDVVTTSCAGAPAASGSGQHVVVSKPATGSPTPTQKWTLML